ncbi:hypothetical protein BamIOP4010DRAFT_5182 [Burkholderia ambifaria IOP40-10]|uniref:Uncharacterized protein n=2 Tax=Burkholderia ambifaria TaxID=152480 RepID=B1FMC1_9BURK|nr:hypothetical protein BamIOP4010DRAFT_5182 [Burkholderia ambifaria IOP40-10]
MADIAGGAGRTNGPQGKIAAFACHSGRPAAGSAPLPAARPPVRRASSMTESDLQSDDTAIHQDGLWHDNGWTARIIKNEDDDGWAVEMIKDGEAEPALVGPWTMGRDKKNPKPMDANAFRTLVKTATEVLMRHEQQRRAMLHKEVTVQDDDGQDVSVTLDIVPDEFEPYAQLKAFDPYGELLADAKVSAGFKLNKASAARWVESGFERPA